MNQQYIMPSENRGWKKEKAFTWKRNEERDIKRFGRKWQILKIAKKAKHMDNRTLGEANQARLQNKY